MASRFAVKRRGKPRDKVITKEDKARKKTVNYGVFELIDFSTLFLP